MAKKPRVFKWRGAYVSDFGGTRTRYGDNRKDAQHALDQAVKKQDGRKIVRGTVAEWGLAFVDQLETENKKPATVDYYRKILRSFGAFKGYGDFPVSKLRVTDFDAFILSRKTNGGKRAAHTFATKFCRYLRSKGVITRDQIDTRDLAKKPAMEKKMVYVSREDFDAILALVTDGAFRDLLSFLFHSGCRPYEAYSLRVRHVDLANKRAVFPPSEVSSKKTGGQGNAREIYPEPEGLEILTRRSAGFSAECFVFRNTRGEPWNINSINSRFEKLRKKLGVRWSPYAFRKGFISRKLEQGLNPLDVAGLVGHRDLTMIMKHYDCHTSKVSNMQRAAGTLAK